MKKRQQLVCSKCSAPLPAPLGHWCSVVVYETRVVACGTPEAMRAALGLMNIDRLVGKVTK